LGPQGGLVIEARDVDKDNIIDLVLATAWLREPVAVLLNDGHGNFSRVEPSRFPGAFTHTSQTWSSTSPLPSGSVGAPPRTESAATFAARSVFRARPPTQTVFTRDRINFVSSFSAPFSGRAPPALSCL
jgi:hypothetical protein